MVKAKKLEMIITGQAKSIIARIKLLLDANLTEKEKKNIKLMIWHDTNWYEGK